MIKVPLSKGHFAIIDEDDLGLISQYHWHKSKRGYAVSSYWKDGKTRKIYMHRLIMGGQSNIDHKDGCKLDNRKSNLRLCSHSQNMYNQKKRVDNTSGFKGVSWSKAAKKWHAYINISKRRVYLGVFNSKEEAAAAYNEAAKKNFGEFARLNQW